MAFGFFRRRQKMVIIIMVVLMVSFLVGYQGFELIFHPNRDPVIGRMGDEKITHSMLVAADTDVRTMEKLVQRSARLQAAFSPLMRDNRGEHDSALAFALLLTEAQKAKVRGSDSEVEASIDQLAREWGSKCATFSCIKRAARPQKSGWCSRKARKLKSSALRPRW